MEVEGTYQNSIYSTGTRDLTLSFRTTVPSFEDAPACSFVDMGTHELGNDAVTQGPGLEFKSVVMYDYSSFLDKQLYKGAGNEIYFKFDKTKLSIQKVAPAFYRKMSKVDNIDHTGYEEAEFDNNVFNNYCVGMLCVLNASRFSESQLTNPIDDVANNRIRIISQFKIGYNEDGKDGTVDIPDFMLCKDEQIVMYYIYSSDVETIVDHTSDYNISYFSEGVKVNYVLTSFVSAGFQQQPPTFN